MKFVTHIGFAHYPTNLLAGTQANMDVVPATIIASDQVYILISVVLFLCRALLYSIILCCCMLLLST